MTKVLFHKVLLCCAAAAGILSVSVAAAHDIPEDFSGFAAPAECAACHETIYGEWKGSMHAGSSKFSDPLHNAVHEAFSAAMAEKGKTPNYHCASCHIPTAGNMEALMKGEAAPDPDDPTNVRGVTCSFCHMADAVIEGVKFNTYRVTEGIKGVNEGGIAPHGSLKWPFDNAYEMCLGCHGKKISGAGGVVCSMADEGVTDCLPCHMPGAEGAPAPGSQRAVHAFHGMHGGHQLDMLEKGATLTLAVSGGVMEVTLTNPNEHYFPSTNPLRIAYVKVEAYDENGAVMFANFAKDPTEDPGSVLMKVFGDGSRVGVPSWEAGEVAVDTRLRPGEVSVIKYRLPECAKSASAKLYYRLAPAGALKKFGVPPDGFTEEPHLVSGAEIML